MIVPGSGIVRNQAVAEGLDKIFIEAGVLSFLTDGGLRTLGCC